MRHRQLDVAGLSIHIVEDGAPAKPAVLFLHGWPQSCAAFLGVMRELGRETHVVAMDLPGIGGSITAPRSNDKRTLARCVRGVVRQLGLRSLTLVGHDVGAQIAYAYLRAYPADLRRVVLMNIAIPGVEPWREIVRNPQIWHFAFHAVPSLPEKLVSGRQAAYFDYFYDRISARPSAITTRARRTYTRAYSRAQALRTAFEWYRAFARDERDNRRVRHRPVTIPVLYLRGEKEPGIELGRYVRGLRQSGLRNVAGRTIPRSGHFAPDEQPQEVSAALRSFMGLGRTR
jgi:pimeloyl-ACP methyl ester carboxylesterase